MQLQYRRGHVGADGAAYCGHWQISGGQVAHVLHPEGFAVLDILLQQGIG